MNSNHRLNNYRYDQNCSGIIFVIIVAIIIFYFSPPLSQNQKEEANLKDQVPPSQVIQEQLPTNNQPIQSNLNPAISNQITADESFDYPPLLVFRQDLDGKTVVRLTSDGKSKVLFYDRDLEEKVLQFLSLSVNNNIFALVGQDTDFALGKLVKISADGKGRLESIDLDSAISLTAAVSSDERQLALTAFNNSELDFGFRLLTNQFKTKKEITVDQSTAGLGLPTWNNNDLAYIKGQASSTTALQIAVAREGKNPQYWDFERNLTITNLAWLDSDQLLMSVEPLIKNATTQAKIRKIDLDNGQITDFFDLPGREDFLVMSNDGKFLALALVETSGNINNENKIIVYNLETNRSREITKAKGIIGWSN